MSPAACKDEGIAAILQEYRKERERGEERRKGEGSHEEKRGRREEMGAEEMGWEGREWEWGCKPYQSAL